MKPEPLITVRSVSDSAEFYCNLLGAQRGHSGDDYAQILLNDETILQLHAYGVDADHASLGDPDEAPGNGVVMWFETDDFDGVLKRIAENSFTLDREPRENPLALQMECWLHDPDGYQVVIAGPSP